jgi:hypothetical protein
VQFVLERQNLDGGFGWQKALSSDAWSTYYCAQTLGDLGHCVPRETALAGWLQQLAAHGGGFAMTPGQSADVWASYYVAKTCRSRGVPLVLRPQDTRWFHQLQHASGGLTWTVQGRRPDVRACYYGVEAWSDFGSPPLDWDFAALSAWLKQQQTTEGGFAFGAPYTEPCLWATFRAVRALAALGERPARAEECTAWILGQWLAGSGFRRWKDYPIVDVWACFSAVGGLRALGIRLPQRIADETAQAVRAFQIPGSGFTYREPEYAGDALATAALCIVACLDADSARARRLGTWLQAAQMPYEGGVMYMPARGAEVRCTLWAQEAARLNRQNLDWERLEEWFAAMQNPDGGFGYWEGRGSDLCATVSALECLNSIENTRLLAPVDHAGALAFVRSCVRDWGAALVPGGVVTSTTTAMAARAFWFLNENVEASRLAEQLARYLCSIGGAAAQPGGLPDLVSTYQVARTMQLLERDLRPVALARLLPRLRRQGGYAWTPLTQEECGPLALCLGRLLQCATEDPAFSLPALNL